MLLSEHGGKTTLRIRSVPHGATEEARKTFENGREAMRQGFTGTLDQLAEYLAKAQASSHITRVVNASRSLVFKAWTDAKDVAQWWGPRGFTNPVCELDVRPGGAIRIHMRGPDGTSIR